MAQKPLKYELIERLLLLKEKQDSLVEQMALLTQEINTLAQPFMSKPPRNRPLMTMSLVAKVLRTSDRWLMCGEIAEAVLALQGQPQFVAVGDVIYLKVKRILQRLRKRGMVMQGGIFWRLKPLEKE